jgi:hypothetical protein
MDGMLRKHLRLDKAHALTDNEYLKPDGIIGIDWHVFDDHVSVNENVGIEGKVFYMQVQPAGTLRVLCLSGQQYPISD